MEEYTLKTDNGKKQIEETVEIDIEKETETFKIPGDGDTNPSAPGDVKSVYDFKQVRIWERGFDFVRLSSPNHFPIFSLPKWLLCACSPILLQYLYLYSHMSYACPQP